MANKSGMTLDTKDFDVKLPIVANKKIPQAAARGFIRVGAMVIRDSIMEEPKVPKSRGVTKEGGRRGQGPGHLRRSQKIERPKIRSGEVSIEVGFNADYAGIVHEMPDGTQWTVPGTGSKYMEAKLIKNKEKYMGEVAEDIRNEGGR